MVVQHIGHGLSWAGVSCSVALSQGSGTAIDLYGFNQCHGQPILWPIVARLGVFGDVRRLSIGRPLL